MNILEFLKNGSGIHIKEKNKGKFTSYCGGKVTDECIQKGKNSSNPTIRKRATFAANARKWKHKSGGRIDFLSLGGIAKDVGNIVRNIEAVANSDIGKAGISMATNLFKGVSNAGKITDAAIAAQEAIDAKKAADRTRSFFEHQGKVKQNDINENPDLYVDGSIIHNQGGVNDENRIYTNAINSFSFDGSKYDQEKQQIMEQAQAAQDQNSAQVAGSIFDQIQGLSTSIFGNKNKAATKGTATGSTIGTTTATATPTAGTTTYVGTNGSLKLNNNLLA